MSEKLFAAMTESIVDGEDDVAIELAQQAIAEGIDPLEAIR